MKILQLLAGGKHGGAETAFVDMCIAMKNAGQDVAVITRPNSIRVPRLENADIDVHTAPFGGAIDLYTRYKIKSVIKTFQPDIMQCWMSRAASKAPRWKASMGVPLYVTFARLGNYYNLKYYRPIERFITITPDIQTYLEKNGIASDHIRHINNFADVEQANHTIDRKAEGVPEEATLLLGLGRLHTDKAFDTLIKAVADIPDAYLWIAGEGPQREELESLITDLKLEGRVRLLGWRDDRAALLQACDICMFTSRDEPFGTVFVQAWAQKTPVIVSDADGPRQFVKDGQDGLITPIDDKEAIVNAIRRLQGDKDLCDSLIQNGYARFQAEFTKDQAVKSYLDFYEKALEELR